MTTRDGVWLRQPHIRQDPAERLLNASGSRGRGNYSYDALKVLQRVWAISGGQYGKYLAATMRILLDLLEAHNELAYDQDRYTKGVRKELLAMSPATIDRYLQPMRAKDAINGVSTTKPRTLLRSAITIRRAGDDVEDEPGFFEGDNGSEFLNQYVIEWAGSTGIYFTRSRP